MDQGSNIYSCDKELVSEGRPSKAFINPRGAVFDSGFE